MLMPDTKKYVITVFRRKKLYRWVFWVSLASFLFSVICVTPSSYGFRYGLVPADLSTSISILASLSASFFAGILVIAFVEAVSLEKELGPMKKLWPFIDRLIANRERKLKITVAAIPVTASAGQKAPGSGEAMAISQIVRLLKDLEMSNAQFVFSYAQDQDRDNGKADWKAFKSESVDRLVLGGPKYCKVTDVFLKTVSCNTLMFEENDGHWRLFLGDCNLTPDAGDTVDYGLICWHETEDEGWWIFIAGLGTNGMIAAGEAITTRKYAEQINQAANGKFSNLAVLVKCTYQNEFTVEEKDLKIKKVFWIPKVTGGS